MKAIAAIFLLLLNAPSAPAQAALPAQPNILLVFTDDQRWDTISALGNPEIKTPVTDRLVQEGFHFTNAYNQGSMVPAVCLYSRSMLVTGRSIWRVPGKLRALTPPPGVPLLPDLVKQAGYETFHTGKPGNASRFANACFDTNIESGKRPESATEHAENVLKFLDQYQGGKPFFIYLAPPVPHDPRVAPAEFRALYDPARITLPKNFLPRHPFDNGELDIRDEKLAPVPRTPEAMREHLADYYATVSHFDHELGRILALLKQKGLDRNTIVIFSSDQGLAVGGRHGLMGKQNLYEHVKPPLVIHGPGIPHGKSDALVYLYDLFPTLCELSGAPVPEVAEGKSLVPIVLGKESKLRDWLFTAYINNQRMVRDDRWKLIAYNVSGVKHTQLFDLRADPDELRDLAGAPEHLPERQRLEGLLATARRQFNDPVDFDAAPPPYSAPPKADQSGKKQ